MKRVLAGAGLVLGLALLATPARSQTGTLRGSVVDTEGSGIADVEVIIAYTGDLTRELKTKTNKRGEFLQVGIQPGDYKILFTRDGYRDVHLDWHVGIGLIELPQPVIMDKGPRNLADAQAKLQAAFKEAVDLADDGKLDESIVAYRAIQDQYPDIPEVHKNLGLIYQQKRDFPAAEKEFLAALDLEPDDSAMLLSLSAVYGAMGQAEKAQAMLDKATEVDPGDPKTQFRKGVMLRNAGENDRAVEAFQAVIEADPSSADAYFNLGQLMVNAAKFPEAIQYLEKYLSLDPTNQNDIEVAKGLIQALKK